MKCKWENEVIKLDLKVEGMRELNYTQICNSAYTHKPECNCYLPTRKT